MRNKCIYLFIFFFYFGFGQQNNNDIDSLSKLSYQVLIDSFYNSSELADKEVFTESILQKSKKEKDTLRQIIAYYFYTNIYRGNRKKPRLLYLDSLIDISKRYPDTDFPTTAYYDKGILLYKERDFKKAINAFVKGNEYATEYSNNAFIFLTNNYIARIKDRTGNQLEALKIHQKNTQFAKKNIKELKNATYLRSLYALAFTHKNSRNIDSASYYNNLGLELSDEFNIEKMKPYFNMNEGVVMYLKKEYDSAKFRIESSKESFKKTNDLPNLSEAYFYLGKIAYDQSYKNEAIKYFKKVDTIFSEINDLFPELRENYLLLRSYYKQQKNLKKQLLYTEKLTKIDSILNSNNMYISDYLKNEFDIPKIISEKEDLIQRLKKTNKSKTTYIYIGVAFILLVIVFFYRRQQIFKKRFEKLLYDSKENRNNAIEINKIEKQKSLLDVPKELVEIILGGLKSFEANKGFLDSSIKLSTLAKLLDTNTNYLSKTINYYKGKNINAYLNELRVEYAIEKLKEDKKFRNYTIKAIAREVGFKSSETFSKTFYKKTGIYPSYFIKQLDKTE
ncbi:DNA-binding transcriptional regulator ChbR [Kordia sp. SMS9]|uniref:helix-turn-helix domain-containing protein n=1 Tax=Kordia sp. SMS9 TaxID=2282170 RepID=UPI000E0D8138|nr:helix-turn-helix domain-containing protein [Kordia sp. SMS9]AXG68192.1 DNA-binding transcriptional regulator ChbR [Kordia sp. SMS9]